MLPQCNLLVCFEVRLNHFDIHVDHAAAPFQNHSFSIAVLENCHGNGHGYQTTM